MPSCNEDGCQVAITGRCVNNLQLDTCPHYSSDENDKIANDTTSQTIGNKNESVNNDINMRDQSEDIVDVYSGKALELYDVNKISLSRVTKLIMLAGMPDAGKTTLILSLMHLFQTRPYFSDYIFAGSKTLLDFEEKGHPSKIASNNDAANTNRTSDKPPQFLHLRVLNTKHHKSSEVLFTDISGERFKAIRDSTDVAKKFTLALRADSFVLFFDTKRITSLEDRASSKTSALGILKSLIQAGTLLSYTHIQVVFSRWDLFSNDNDKVLHSEYINLLKVDIEKLLAGKYPLSYFEVAARPATPDFEFGHGIEELLKAWLQSGISGEIDAPLKRFQNGTSSRHFLNFRTVQ